MSYPYASEVAAFLPYAPVFDLTDITATRAYLAEVVAAAPPFELSDKVQLAVRSVPGIDDAPSVDILVLSPVEAPVVPRPALLWFHGGGFVLGDAAESLSFLESIVLDTGAVAVSVQYRLAPETTFPGPVDDGAAALSWLVENADELAIDLDRVAIGGQSAGGALAAGLVLRMRDEAGPRVAFQLLDIPVLDDRGSTESARLYDDTAVWTRKNAELSWRAYLGETVGAPVSPYASPARATDLRGLPPAFIGVNQFDPLRDEGLEYARRLAQAGVPTDLHLYAGTFHGSAAIAAPANVSKRQVSDLRAAFARAVAASENDRGD